MILAVEDVGFGMVIVSVRNMEFTVCNGEDGIGIGNCSDE